MMMIGATLPLLLLTLLKSTMALASVSPTQKIALITGSNKGIGYEIARKIGSVKGVDDDENAFVCILGCRNEELGRQAMEKLQAEGMNVDFCKIDLEDKDSITSAAAYIEKTYGGRCDVLVNNAAVCFNDPTLYGKVSHTPFDEQADITIRTNFFGTLALTEAMLPLLEKSESGRIINIASSAGRLSILPSQERRDAFSSETLELKVLQGYMKDFVKAAKAGNHKENGWPNTGYGVSKVGIIAMTKLFARKYPKLMVNSVDPGYCRTDQNANQGFVPPERGATTPFLLATMLDGSQQFSALHWYEEQAIAW